MSHDDQTRVSVVLNLIARITMDSSKGRKSYLPFIHLKNNLMKFLSQEYVGLQAP